MGRALGTTARALPTASILVFSAFVLCACASRPPESEFTRTELPAEAIPLLGSFPAQAPVPAVAQRLANPSNTILALSGGGADGAFGAGVLVGWSDSGKRPRFDTVSGVSTGAFMAALAFAGPQYDGTIAKLYTQQSSSNIYVDKGASGLASDSLFDNTPLAKLIERTVTKSFVAEIAAQHAAGRRLYVATTNLDAGELVVWDMGQIAGGNRQDPVQMFQKILRASAAVPGFFPPVYIKPQKGVEVRQAHVDGGVKAPILIRSFMFEAPANNRKLYVVVNGSLNLHNARESVQANVADIGRKSINELLRSLLDTTLYQGYVAAKNSGTEFNLLAIPDHMTPSKNALDFNSAKMKELFAAGRDAGRSANAWAKEPPRLEKFEHVRASADKVQIASP